MKRIFENMEGYQIVLVFLGTIIFLALVFILIWHTIKKESYIKLLPFFLISVLMIAFPMIQSIGIDDKGGFSLVVKEGISSVNENPADAQAVNDLANDVAKMEVSQSYVGNFEQLLILAEAKMALSQYDDAEVYVKEAEAINPGSSELAAIKDTLEARVHVSRTFAASVNDLQKEANKITTSSDNKDLTASRQRMLATLQAMKMPRYTAPAEMAVVARSLAIVGDNETSEKIMDEVIANEPENQQMKSLKDSIVNKSFERKLGKPEQPKANPINRKEELFLKNGIIRPVKQPAK